MGKCVEFVVNGINPVLDLLAGMESDKYEQKLYQMFSSYDSEERNTLNREELTKLCISLELRDAGASLIADLFASTPKGDKRVSYGEFKEALLKFLGNEMPANSYESGKIAHLFLPILAPL